MRARGPDRVTLKRPSPLPVWAQIAWRVAFVLFLLGLALLVHWLERDGLKDSHDGAVSFLDVIYFTMISITTTGYGDIVPTSNSARMFDAFVVTPIRIFFVLIFIGTAYSLVFRRSWEKWRMERIQRALSGHVIIAGFGISGAEALDELLARGQAASEVVVIDPDPEALERPNSLGCATVEADATRDKVLQAVRVAQARAMIVAPGRDDNRDPDHPHRPPPRART
jgi:voltage-gated potassium channel